ncbi:MAG: NAD(P)/FAD-dependent oxidoreductase [Saprospiraceae bacterium]|nr:NAD(P)/FAD-dependent oxidoreductase [Saprospiraceae bacterium]MCC6414238.1 NAD(P)/FAD-dependent oxidoreductase [Saprospiraceae bacterium]
MKTHFQILIIGGGNAGIALSAQLLRKDGKLDIAIVEPSEKHYYQPAWTLVGGGVYNQTDTERTEASVMPAKVEWIHDAAASFEPENNTIVTASGKRYSYDYLVVAPGIQLDWNKIKGLEGNLGKYGITSNFSYQSAPYTFELISNLKKGKAIFTNPNTPIKCGGAPQKAMYLSSDYWRKHGVLGDVQVHFYSAASMIFGIKEYRETLEKVIARYGIQTHFFHNLVEVKAQEKIAIFDVYKDGQVVDQVQDTYDMIHITPPQSAPDFIKSSPLAVPGNPLGWIDVDKFTFQHVRFSNIYALGDASSTPNAKTGAAVRKQVPVLVEQLVSQIYHQKPSPDQYHGYGSCPLVTGYGKLVMAEFDYENKRVETFPFDQSKERLSMYLLKTQVLPRLYWNFILKGMM